jgi:hypothetical protein
MNAAGVPQSHSTALGDRPSREKAAPRAEKGPEPTGFRYFREKRS